MTVVNCPISYRRTIIRSESPTVIWATLHDATVGTSIANLGQEEIQAGSTSDRWVHIYRVGLTFNTSETYIPAGATIISAQVRIGFSGGDWSNPFAGSPSVNIYGFTPANKLSYDIEDYDQFGTTLFCDTPIAFQAVSPVEGSAVDPMLFTLNAAGLAAIVRGVGVRTALSLRNSYDALNSIVWVGGSVKYALSGIPQNVTYVYIIVTYTLVTVATNAATNITQVSAQLNGTVTNDSAEVAYVSFDWGLTSSYGNSTLEEAKLSSGAFNKNIGNNLAPDTTYHFRAKARIGTYTTYGSDVTFRTGTPTLSSDSPIRVSAIRHLWSAGPEPVYKAEVYTGGLQSSYLPPISDKEPLPSIEARTTPEQLAKLGIGRTGTAMSQTNALFQYGVWLSQHTAREINAIFKHQPTFAEWWAWYQVYGRQP